MKKIRVLMLVPNLFVANGVTSFVMNYVRNIDHNALQIDFVSYAVGPSPYYEELEKLGSKIFFISSFRNMSRHIQECSQILKQGNYDIVHDNTLHISVPMMWCAKYYKVPVRILHSHNSKMGETKFKELRNNAFMPLLKSFANANVACSNVAGIAMFNNKDFCIIPNVINRGKYILDQRVRYKVRKDLNVGNKKVLCTVGRLAEQKNPYFAVNVFRELLKSINDVEYWWIGSGPLEKDIKSYIKKQHLEKHIKLFGNRNNVVDYLQAADLFFLPSKFEGLPVTGIEAQAMGLPTIASKSITDEMVFTDLVDFVNLNDSIETWVTHMKNAIQMNFDRKVYAEALQKSVYNDEYCGERLLNVYRSLLKDIGR